MHLARDRWPHQHLITQFLQAGCSCWHPNHWRHNFEFKCWKIYLTTVVNDESWNADGKWEMANAPGHSAGVDSVDPSWDQESSIQQQHPGHTSLQTPSPRRHGCYATVGNDDSNLHPAVIIHCSWYVHAVTLRCLPRLRLWGVVCPWFHFSFWQYKYCLLVYIVCFPTYSLFFPYLSHPLLIFSFENRPAPFRGRMS